MASKLGWDLRTWPPPHSWGHQPGWRLGLGGGQGSEPTCPTVASPLLLLPPHVGLGSESLHPQHLQQARTCMSSLTVVDCLLARVLQGPAVLPAFWSHHSGESRSTGGAQRRGDSARIPAGACVLQALLDNHRTPLWWTLPSGLGLQLTLLTRCSGVSRLCFWKIRENSGSHLPPCELDPGSLGPKCTPAPLRLRRWPPHTLPHVPS